MKWFLVPSQPYVVIEIDEPPQKHTTTLGLNACPVWDEHFLFDVNRRSEELLFEVYDKRKSDTEEPKFVGLAIVGVEELRQSAITSHALKLQPRPYTNDRAQGVLYVEVNLEKPYRFHSDIVYFGFKFVHLSS